MSSASVRRARLLLVPIAFILIFYAWSRSSSSSIQPLWSYIEGDSTGVEVWEWIRSNSYQERYGYRRPSWGGLREQGAKAHLRDNLKDGMKYLSGFPTAGWNNQVMEILTSAYIAFLTNRTPVLQHFFAAPTHLGGEAPTLAVGDVFDLSRLALYFDKPVVEVHELKTTPNMFNFSRTVRYDGEHPRGSMAVGTPIHAETPMRDEIGCWSTRMLFAGGTAVWNSFEPAVIDFIPVPMHTHSRADREYCALGSLADHMKDNTGPLKETSDRLKAIDKVLPPNLPEDQFQCIDSVYWCHTDPERRDLHGEWHLGDGAWNNVGTHMRWQPGLIQLADDYLRHAFGLPANAPLPHYMAIHIRRGDFSDMWKRVTPRMYAYRAWQVLRDAATAGISASKVIVTTDEKDPEWLDQLRAYGFIIVDHTAAKTGERLGWWMPTVLDAVLLSRAKVLVGVPASTMTILAKRRVIDWNEGLARMMDPFLEVPVDWEW